MYYVQIFTYHVGPFQGWMWVRVVDIPKLEHQIYIFLVIIVLNTVKVNGCEPTPLMRSWLLSQKLLNPMGSSHRFLAQSIV